MTSPTNVGTVEVDIVAEARSLAKSLRKELESTFKGLDFRRIIEKSIGTRPVKVPVDLLVNSGSLPSGPVKVPVEPDFAGFAAKLRGLHGLAPISVPVAPDLSRFTALLRAGVSAAASRVSANVNVNPSGFGNIGGNLTNQMGTAAGAISSLLAPLGAVSAGLLGTAGAAGVMAAAIVGAALVAIPAVTTLAGLLASIPGLVSGVGFGVGTLALGFKGISEAFEPKAGGGGGGGQSAAARARQIAGAARSVAAARRGVEAANRNLEASERSLAGAQRGVEAAQRRHADSLTQVAEAQKRATLATAAISRARRDAVEDIEDLNRALRGAVISEEEAAAAVDDALFALNEARLTGDLKAIRRAENAYDRAVLGAEEAADAVQDLQAQTDEANAKGVEGSDRVVAALEAQQDALAGVEQAQQGVLDAQIGMIDAADSFKSAQDGVLSAQDGIRSAADGLTSALESQAAAQEKVGASAGGIGKEVTKLAPAAQRFVNAIKALKPAFEDLRLDVQERLFVGLDKTVTMVAKAWEKPLGRIFGSYADTFNGFAKNLGKGISTPKFIADMEVGAEGFRQLMDKVFGAVTNKLVPAFGALSKAAGPFLSKLGDELAGIVTQFSDWVLQGEKTGGLKDFFDRAAVAMHEIFRTGKLVGSILGSIFEILTGGPNGGSARTSPLESFNDGLQVISAWLKDSKNQQKIRDFMKDVKDAVVDLVRFGQKVQEVFGKISNVIDKVGEIGTRIKIALGVADDDKSAGQGIGKALAGAVNPGGGGSLLAMAKQAGRDLIEGLAEGIAEEIDDFDIGKLLWKGPDSLLGKIKAGFGIKSPSTVMMEVGKDLVLGLIKGIVDKVADLVKSAGELPGKVKDAVVGAGKWLYDKGRDAVIGLGDGIVSAYQRLRTTAGTVRNTVVSGVQGAGTWLYNKGQEASAGIANGIRSLFPTVSATAGNLRPTVANPVAKGASSLLYSSGQNMALGLARGIDSMAARIGRSVATLAANVASRLRSALEERSPSRVTFRIGAYAGEGLALGMDSTSKLVGDTAERLANLAVPDIGTVGFGADLDAQLSRSLSVNSNRTLTARWSDSASADPVLRALQNHIVLDFNGDVQAALGG